MPTRSLGHRSLRRKFPNKIRDMLAGNGVEGYWVHAKVPSNFCTGCVRLRKVFTLLSTSKQTAYFKNSLNQLNHTPYFKSMCSQFRCNCENMLYHATKNSRPPHIFKQAVRRPWKQGVGSSTEINATGKCDKKRYETMTMCKNPWHGFLQDTQTRLEIVTARQLEIHGKTSVKMGARFHWFIASFSNFLNSNWRNRALPHENPTDLWATFTTAAPCRTTS